MWKKTATVHSSSTLSIIYTWTSATTHFEVHSLDEGSIDSSSTPKTNIFMFTVKHHIVGKACLRKGIIRPYEIQMMLTLGLIWDWLIFIILCVPHRHQFHQLHCKSSCIFCGPRAGQNGWSSIGVTWSIFILFFPLLLFFFLPVLRRTEELKRAKLTSNFAAFKQCVCVHLSPSFPLQFHPLISYQYSVLPLFRFPPAQFSFESNS